MILSWIIMEEAKSNLRCVYVQTTLCLWRFDFEAIDSNCNSDCADGSGDIGKGVVTQLIDFKKAEVPLGAGGFVFNSELFFVGGETVKTNTPWVRLRRRGSFDDEDEFNAIYGFDRNFDSKESADRAREACHDFIGYLKLPRSALSKRVFVLNQFYDSNSEPLVPSITILPPGCQSKGPKTRPFVVPFKKGDKTLIYVVGRSPLFYEHCVPEPTFEVFDPDHNSWETLEPPPQNSGDAFEFCGKIFLFTPTHELCFDIETKEWQYVRLFVSKPFIPSCMINVCGDIYLGCGGSFLRAYQLGPDNKMRDQGIELLSESFDERWHYNANSTLCNLGDGHVLSVFTSMDFSNNLLRFLGVRFRISLMTEEERKDYNETECFLYCPDPFVSFKFIDSHQGDIEYEPESSTYNEEILNAYLL